MENTSVKEKEYLYEKPVFEKEMARDFKENVSEVTEPKFRDPRELSLEQLTDPDYRLKQLEKLNGGKLSILCSKCHHCR